MPGSVIRVLLAVGYALVAETGVAASMERRQVRHHYPWSDNPNGLSLSVTKASANMRVSDGTCVVSIQSSPEQIEAAIKAMEKHKGEPEWSWIRVCPISSSGAIASDLEGKDYFFICGERGTVRSGSYWAYALPVTRDVACDNFARVRDEIEALIDRVDHP